MTPQTLIQLARKASPRGWKGQQTVIRRLARTRGLPANTMHDALRGAAKAYRRESPMHKTQTFRPNKDTPPDLRAEYLRSPHEFGIGKHDDILAFAREASNATVLKMTSYSGIACLVLFEREHGDAYNHIKRLAETRPRGEFFRFQLHLASCPWTKAQFTTMKPFEQSANMWHESPWLLDRFLQARDQYDTSPLDMVALSERSLRRYPLDSLLMPYNHPELHKEALAESFSRMMGLNSNQQEECFSGLNAASDAWHGRNPSEQDCLGLAAMLDAAQLKLLERKPKNIDPWQERAVMVIPWVAMMGTNGAQGQQAVDLYRSIDPALLTFTTICSAVLGKQMDLIDNASELLCP